MKRRRWDCKIKAEIVLEVLTMIRQYRADNTCLQCGTELVGICRMAIDQ